VPLDAETVRRLRALPATYDVARSVGTDSARQRGLIDRRALGFGDPLFRAASDVVLSWRMHERAGFGVRASDAEVVVGTVVVLTTRFGSLSIEAPCRVVRVTVEPMSRGFAYVTLPGHPVSGEEEFLVQQSRSGVVTATVTAVSQPASVLARIGSPVTRRQQLRIAGRYLDALVAESHGA
jgi:uncharacterized protein (UPF0548 family)